MIIHVEKTQGLLASPQSDSSAAYSTQTAAYFPATFIPGVSKEARDINAALKKKDSLESYYSSFSPLPTLDAPIVRLSGWNPVLSHRQIIGLQYLTITLRVLTTDAFTGDLIYLEVQFDDNETLFVTGHRNGFYVNKYFACDAFSVFSWCI